MHRFFVGEEDITGKVVKVTGSDFNHISHSLRLNEGDKIIVCNQGIDNVVELTKFTDKFVEGIIVESKVNYREPEINITLAQAIPKKSNMDLIVQKCTEIGVSSIIPLQTKRTIVKLKGKKKQKRINRWQRIAREAAKQCQRGNIPLVKNIYDIKDIEKIKDNYDLILIPYENEKVNNFQNFWNSNTREATDILVIIGPEGGFTEQEVKLVEKMGGKSVSLGPRILRTETAGMISLTMILYEIGDLGGKTNG